MMSVWIDVNERLPGEGEEVMIWRDGASIEFTKLDKEGWTTGMIPTHWTRIDREGTSVGWTCPRCQKFISGDDPVPHVCMGDTTSQKLDRIVGVLEQIERRLSKIEEYMGPCRHIPCSGSE